MKIAYKNGADYIWGMDDDAWPQREALQALVDATKIYPSYKACLCGNTHYVDRDGKTVTEYVAADYAEMNSMTFISFFISREIIDKVGFPKEELFIYYDDLEYSFRVREHGFKIIGVKNAVVEHPYIMDRKYGKIFFKMFSVPEMPTWKRYYWMRNGLLVHRKAGRKFFHFCLLEFTVLIKLLFLERDQWGIAMLGFYHGIIEKSGHLKNMP